MAEGWESIASDCEDAPFLKLLSQDTISRMADKFSSFREDRVKIRNRMENYVRDYNAYEGSATRRYEMLEEEYADGAPDLSHLVPGSDGEASSALWSMRDMAIILGRNVSSILRTIRRMKDSPEWGAALAAHESRPAEGGRGAAVLFDSGVFDVVVDFFESVYLERFTSPRRGTPMTGAEREAAYSLWEYMKADPDAAQRLGAIRLVEGGHVYGSRMGRTFENIYRNLRIIVKRACSIKPGTFFLLLFALVYELSKRYPFLNIAVPAASVAALVCALAAMGRRKEGPVWLADIGACSVTLSLLWVLAIVASPDGPASKLLPSYQTENAVPSRSADDAVYAKRLEEIKEEIASQNNAPSTNASRPEESSVKVEYSRSGGENGKFDVWVHTGPQTKEILYRTSPNGDFKSTGFSASRGADGSKRPMRSLALNPESAENLWIKYIDDDGATHGPYEIHFDYGAERMKAAKKMLDEDIEWVEFTQDENGTSVSTNVVSDLAFSLSDRGIVERVMYGVNRKTPNMERTFLTEGETEYGLPDALRDVLQSYLVTDSTEKIWFVSMKIVFSDGSESDIRIFDNPFADGVT
jgi:hypothetical protein